jgi:hypothetical protein
MTVLKFVKTENGTGSRIIGKLQWGMDSVFILTEIYPVRRGV